MKPHKSMRHSWDVARLALVFVNELSGVPLVEMNEEQSSEWSVGVKSDCGET
ncbi:hypothetical protein ABIC51_008047 [Burkholderia sp. 572]